MFRKLIPAFICALLFIFSALPAAAQKSCFSQEARDVAERTAKVYRQPDPGYDPVLGYNPAVGPRVGAPPVGPDGLAAAITCVADPKENEGSGTTPKFYCSVAGAVDEKGEPVRYKIKPHFKGQTPEKRNGEVYGEFLSSRFSKALGFFADDEWVADVTCNDCEKSLNKKFQGTSFNPFQPAAGIELPLGSGIDVKCNNKDTGALSIGIECQHGGAASLARPACAERVFNAPRSQSSRRASDSLSVIALRTDRYQHPLVVVGEGNVPGRVPVAMRQP